MHRFKKAGIVLLVIAVLGIPAWWFFSRHSVPPHARYIPKDVIAVATVNTKRIATDLLWAGELKADTNTPAAHKFQNWKKALETSGWAGINPGADLLVFTNTSPDGKLWYNGLVIRVDDASKLNLFLSTQLPHLLDSMHVHATSVINHPNYQSVVIVNDDSESPLSIGFNKDVLVVLRLSTPSSDLSFFEKEFKKIFSLAPESSLLGEEDFCISEKKSADILFWLNLNRLQKLFNPQKEQNSAPGYVNAWMDFEKGKITIEAEGISKAGTGLKPILNTHATDPDFNKQIGKDQFMGMAFFHLNLPNLFERFRADGKNAIGETLMKKTGLTPADLSSAFTGQVELAMNGLITYPEKYTENVYDEDFNRTEIQKIREAHLPGMLIRFHITNPAALAPLVPKLMARELIEPYKNGFRLKTDAPVYMISSGNFLYLTTFPEVPAENKDHWTHPDLEDLQREHGNGFFINFGGLYESFAKDPIQKAAFEKPNKLLENMTWTVEEEDDGNSKSHLVIHFNDKKMSSLAQLIKLSTTSNP
ncbi:MAG TPA: DUF4836 family protein [Bacteroidia bacterium]|jgi:hypothetical protein|nr:DUF4836 family protein [Bacteroidia bacterium]